MGMKMLVRTTMALAVIAAAFGLSGGSALQTIPLVFHLPEGDVPSEINPETIQVLFNPKELAVGKATPLHEHNLRNLDSPTLEFTAGEPYRLQVELFFDTFEQGTDVRELTDKIEKLAIVEGERHRPTSVLVTWGTGLQFKAVIEHVQTRFTLFKEDGTPLRATMNSTFKEFSPADEQLKQTRRR